MDETLNDPTTETPTETPTDPTTDPTTPETGGETPPATPTEPDYKAVSLDVLEDMFLAFGQGLPGLLVGEGEGGGTSGLTTRLLPPGGALGYVISKVSGADYDIGWTNPGTLAGSVPVGGRADQVLTKGSDTDYDLHWETITIPEVVKLTTAEVTSIASGNVAEITDASSKVLGVNGMVELFNIIDEKDNAKAVTADATTISMSANNVVSIAASGVTETHIADNAVKTAKINNGAVTTAKVADANITKAKLAADVWTEVNNIMNNGFAEVLNGTY